MSTALTEGVKTIPMAEHNMMSFEPGMRDFEAQAVSKIIGSMLAQSCIKTDFINALPNMYNNAV